MRDLKSNIDVVQALVPVTQSATKTDAAVIDLQGCDSAAVIVNTGAITGSGIFAASLVHGDQADLSDSAAVPASALQGAFPAALDQNSAYTVGYIGTKRYIRVVLTKTSGTSIEAGAVVVRGDLAMRPAA